MVLITTIPGENQGSSWTAYGQFVRMWPISYVGQWCRQCEFMDIKCFSEMFHPGPSDICYEGLLKVAVHMTWLCHARLKPIRCICKIAFDLTPQKPMSDVTAMLIISNGNSFIHYMTALS